MSTPHRLNDLISIVEQPPKVLILEDEDIALVMKDQIETNFYVSADCSRTKQSAEDFIHRFSNRYRVVFVDIRIAAQEHQGIQFIEENHHMAPGAQFIVFSSYIDDDVKKRLERIDHPHVRLSPKMEMANADILTSNNIVEKMLLRERDVLDECLPLRSSVLEPLRGLLAQPPDTHSSSKQDVLIDSFEGKVTEVTGDYALVDIVRADHSYAVRKFSRKVLNLDVLVGQTIQIDVVNTGKVLETRFSIEKEDREHIVTEILSGVNLSDMEDY